MNRYLHTLIVSSLCLAIVLPATAGPSKKKTKRHHHATAHTSKAMQKKHLNRTLQEKGFVRFKDSVQKGK